MLCVLSEVILYF